MHIAIVKMSGTLNNIIPNNLYHLLICLIKVNKSVVKKEREREEGRRKGGRNVQNHFQSLTSPAAILSPFLACWLEIDLYPVQLRFGRILKQSCDWILNYIASRY